MATEELTYDRELHENSKKWNYNVEYGFHETFYKAKYTEKTGQKKTKGYEPKWL